MVCGSCIRRRGSARCRVTWEQWTKTDREISLCRDAVSCPVGFYRDLRSQAQDVLDIARLRLTTLCCVIIMLSGPCKITSALPSEGNELNWLLNSLCSWNMSEVSFADYKSRVISWVCQTRLNHITEIFLTVYMTNHIWVTWQKQYQLVAEVILCSTGYS